MLGVVESVAVVSVDGDGGVCFVSSCVVVVVVVWSLQWVIVQVIVVVLVHHVLSKKRRLHRHLCPVSRNVT